MVTVTDRQVRVETRTLTAVFDGGVLVSLVRRADGREFVDRANVGEGAPLQLAYRGEEAVPLGGRPGDRVSCLRLNDSQAEIRFETWNGDGLLAVGEDPESGELIVEPGAFASRPGLWACRWVLSGVDSELELVAPLFQGVRLPLGDSLLRNTRWHWPHFWEAGLVILQGKGGGFWVHCRDDRYRYKALRVGTPEDANRLGFETEAYGPLDGNLAAGGLAWRINVYEGDWRVPAGLYRDWLWKAYGLDGAERPEWLDGLRLAVSWCPCETELLAALAEKVAPGKVLLHVPNWRTDGYDENYPTYAASEKGEAFVRRAQAMGFRTMPHFNSVDMDPTHPVYASVRDFQYRELAGGRVQGWTWHEGKVLPVPESNAARLRHQDKKTMVKIHPGLSAWRSILAENVRAAADALGLEVVFLDVTLCTWNLHNCLVEGLTSTEGMKRLIAQVGRLGRGLAVGGEGRNEMTMQGQCLGQAHLFKSWQASAEGLARTGGCALGEFLFGRLCRSFGYSGLGGRSPEEERRMKLHVQLGAIPTLTVRSASDIVSPNEAVKEMLALAAE